MCVAACAEWGLFFFFCVWIWSSLSSIYLLLSSFFFSFSFFLFLVDSLILDGNSQRAANPKQQTCQRFRGINSKLLLAGFWNNLELKNVFAGKRNVVFSSYSITYNVNFTKIICIRMGH